MRNLLALSATGSRHRLPARLRAWLPGSGKLLLLGVAAILRASSAAAQCPGATTPTNFASWDWETPAYDASGNLNGTYCNTWHANIGTGGVTAPKDMRAPWDIAGTPSIDLIAKTGDYKKANGWQLVRFDFGGKGSVPVPYFMLYHRLTGVLRIYAYIANTAGYTGSVITLSHASANQGTSGHSTATLSTTNALLQAPDKYFSQSATTYSQEQMTYVGFIGSRENWTMAQFTMALDPRVNDVAYQLNGYQVQIFGLVQSDVKLAGSFEFETTQTTKDFSYGGPAVKPTPSKLASAGADAQDFAMTAQKYLGNLSTVSDKITDITTKAKKFADIKNTTGVVKELQGLSSSIATSGFLKTLGSVAGQLGALGGVFGLAGTVIGFFTDDATAKTAFVPTTSKGTISLTGTITTKSPLHTFGLLTPAARHYDNNTGSTVTPEPLRSQLPYNDCALGIFNIQNTPVVRYVRYDQWTTEKFSSYDRPPGSGEMRRLTSIKGYQLTNDVLPTVNANSGLEIVSVQMALAQKVKLSEFARPFYDTHPDGGWQLETTSGSWRDRWYNFLYGQVASGEAIILPYDPGTTEDASDAQVIYQTPFASCYNALYGFTAPESVGAPYLRIIAKLHVKGTPPDSAPVYYAQDYAVDLVPATSTWPSTTQPLNARPYFQVQYDGNYPRPASVYAPNITKTGTLVYDDYTYGAEGEVAFSTLLFDANSAVSLRGGQNYRNIVFQASRSVGFAGSLAVPSGFSVAISTDPSPLYPPSYYTCSASQLQYNQTNIPCRQDGQALRTAQTVAPQAKVEAELATLALAPNPATGTTVAHLKVASPESIQQLEVVNVQGQVLWKKACDNGQEISEPISLSTFQPGVYIVRVTTSTGLYNSKLVVQ